MLILSRKAGQSIIIQLDRTLPWKTPAGALFAGGPIEVMVNQVKGGEVKLGIIAHPDLLVLRDELLEK